jgi:hypothetical protein
MILKTEKAVFVFEFKLKSTAKTALEQILEMRYFEQYRTGGREIVLVGVNFDTQSRSINEWKSQLITQMTGLTKDEIA